MVFGELADRIGSGPVLTFGCAVLAIVSLLFYQEMSVSTDNINTLYALCGFFVGVIGVVPGVAVRAFPAVVRFSGLSFSYNVAYAVFGGLTPVFVSLLLVTDRMAPAHYVVAVCTLGVMVGVYLWRKDVLEKPI
jgi:uncharacterized membrane protein